MKSCTYLSCPLHEGKSIAVRIGGRNRRICNRIYAESRPEPLQLQKAAFQLLNASGEVCCQAKIQISNRHFNWLTRNFAGEYYEWYEQHLVELAAAGLPFGLGGNSFFVSKKALIEAGAWDPYNVTEDADLSVRLIQNRVKLSILDSYTSETCPEAMMNWINQRTRWNKGLFITQLVHLRKTLFTPAFKFQGWLSFWLRMICAAALPFFNLYIALYMLLANLSYFQTFLFSAILWFMLAVNLLVSWIINITTYRRLGIQLSYPAVFWDSFRYLFLHIIAGYKSYWEYFMAPLHWNKTVH
ncbi:MAG: glycosyltransferase [Haliscomenobacter sp.]|nr:glycosyltransferase [Haliscomenobacter sp.]